MKVCMWIFETHERRGETILDQLRIFDDNRLGGDEDVHWHSGDMFAITREGRSKISCDLQQFHVQNEGWPIAIHSPQVLPTPCLLTDDANVRMVFDGPVRLRDRNKPFYSRIAITLASTEWFGVAFGIGPRPNGTKMRLIAFSSKIDRLPAAITGRCPPWGEAIEIALA